MNAAHIYSIGGASPMQLAKLVIVCMAMLTATRLPAFPTLLATTRSRARMSVLAQASTPQAMNVLGGPLKCCCKEPLTGYYRDGFCRTGGGDFGVHVVCAQVSEDFLAFTASKGNDLSTPVPGRFPGLKPGDRWCLCASRWKEAHDAGKAPPVVLSGCHIRALDYVDLDVLKQYALPEEEAAAKTEL